MKKAFFIQLQVFFYLIAGINHFIVPDFYHDLIPPFFEQKNIVNILAGIAEILLALGLLNSETRKTASILIIIMLISFIPSHVYFIQLGSCVEGGLCVPEWIGIVRLIVIHPLLVYWAWKAKDV